jgi:imidazolonepropionase-like amidohydrolase
VTTVLDLGAPMPYATAPHAPLRYRFAGPLLTAPGGYPTGSWGAAGYGLEVAHIDDARAAVTRLHDAGAAIIKVALESSEGPELDADLVRCIVEEAHAHGLRVAAHALAASSVATAAECGVDVLAHTPTQELPAEVVRSCAGMIVISTVRAFAGSPTTVRNLTRLVEAGCTAVYGTDLGNGAIRPGIDTAELEILASVLAGPDAALAAATSAASGLAGCGGRVAEGEPADLVWVPAFERLGDLAGEPAVWVGGHRVLA